MSPPLIDVSVLSALLYASLICFGVCFIGYLLARLVTPKRYYRMKRERYEAGNPPRGRGRGWFMMQYYAYLIVFLTLEPIMIYLFLILIEIHSLFRESSILFLVLIIMLIPPLIFGLDSARRVKLWLAGE